MKRLVIFDLDGTLLDTVADLAAATNHALAQGGFPPHPTESYYRFVGNGIGKLMERALPANERTPQRVQQLLPHFVDYYGQHCCDLTTPYAGIAQLLDTLQQAGVMMAVASNKYMEGTQKLVSRFFPTTRFVAVLGQREGVPLKPDAAVVNEILSLAGVGRDATLYVGDSGVDVETARNAGVEMAAVAWGFWSREQLVATQPRHLIESTQQILELVNAS